MRTHSPRYRPMGAGYVSEFDQFMDDYLARRPAVAEQRQRRWYVWWDHVVDLDELARQRQDSVPVKPYHYD
jgi:hypothetical protein